MALISVAALLAALALPPGWSTATPDSLRSAPKDSSASEPGLSEEARISLAFGDYLFENDEYARAVIEYLRHRFVTGSDAPDVQLRLGRCRLRLDQPARAAQEFSRGLALASSTPLADSLRFGITACALRLKAHPNAGTPPALRTILDSESLAERREALFVLDQMLDDDWEGARARLKTIHRSNEGGQWMELQSVLADHDSVHLKSPLLAASMSAVIPGSGKVYSGRTVDGVSSLLMFSFAAWEAYRGFRDDGNDSVRGWIFGSLALFFYGGNIYGSLVAVQIYNDHIEDALSDHLGLAVRYWTRF